MKFNFSFSLLILSSISNPLFGKPHYSLEVKLDLSNGILEGKETIETEVSDNKIEIWLYPNRFSQKPRQMNPESRFWIYPHGFNPGWMKIIKILCNEKDITDTIENVKLPSTHPLKHIKKAAIKIKLPGQVNSSKNKITIFYQVKIPGRYNLFGKTSNGILMLGGWYPFLVKNDTQGQPDYFSPPEKAGVNLSITVPPKIHLIINDHYFPPFNEKDSKRINLSFDNVSNISIGAFKKIHSFEIQCHNIRIIYYSEKEYKTAKEFNPEGEEIAGIPVTITDAASPDRVGRLLETICNGIKNIEEQNIPIDDHPAITIIEVPLRMELTGATENVIFVSDRIYSLFPFEKFWKFHDIALLRAYYNFFFLNKLKKIKLHSDTCAMEADFCASFMVDAFVRKKDITREYAEDIIKWVSFLSSMDYLLYSPMVQFRETYFKVIAEKDWLRDEEWAFMNLQPRGKLIYEKLLDILGWEKIKNIFYGIIEGKGSIEELVSIEAGNDMKWFFNQWSISYPSLNYRIGKIEEKKATGKQKTYIAHIFREGNTDIKEPVKVRFVFSDGSISDRVWFDSGKSGVAKITTDKKLVNVIIDPDFRLFEDPDLVDNNPRYDNAIHWPLRPPVFSGLYLWSSIFENQSGTGIMFNVRQMYDILKTLQLYIEASSEGYGGSIIMLKGLGKKLDRNFSKFYTGFLIGGFYNNKDYGFLLENGEEVPATSIFGGIYAGYNSLFHPIDPENGMKMYIKMAYHLNIDNRGSIYHGMSVNGRIFYLYSLPRENSLAFYAAAGGAFFEMPKGHLQNLSNRLLLRGFESDEARGRIMLFSGMEFRHLWIHGLNINLINIIKIEGIRGILFGGAGTVSAEDSHYGMFSADRIFAEAGYGLAVLILWLGAYPSLIEIDFAVPVYPLPDERSPRSNGTQRQKFGIFISFTQTH